MLHPDRHAARALCAVFIDVAARPATLLVTGLMIGTAFVFTTGIGKGLRLGLRVWVWVATICRTALPLDTLLTSLTVPVRTAATAVIFLAAFTVVANLTSSTISVGPTTIATVVCFPTNAPITGQVFPAHVRVPTPVSCLDRPTLHAFTSLTATAVEGSPTEVLGHTFAAFPITALPLLTIVVR